MDQSLPLIQQGIPRNELNADFADKLFEDETLSLGWKVSAFLAYMIKNQKITKDDYYLRLDPVDIQNKGLSDIHVLVWS